MAETRSHRVSVRAGWWGAFCLFLLTISSFAGGCDNDEDEVLSLDVRPVRVLLFDTTSSFRLRVQGTGCVKDRNGDEIDRFDDLPWTEVDSDTNGIRLGDTPLDQGVLELVADQFGGLQLVGNNGVRELPLRTYAGVLRIEALADGGLRVTNYVDLESYLLGVVYAETWPEFHDETLAVQAIVARTYALYMMTQRAGGSYDVRATEGDQVYRGISLDEKAERVRDAVNRTRGVVLCWDSPRGPRLFRCYYSAACGGMSQSAAFIQGGEIPTPLTGEIACDYCSIAPGQAYRWGPSEISKEDLFRRLVARRPALESLRSLAGVRIDETTPDDRLALIALLGEDEAEVVVLAEWFRIAVGSRTMRSTNCRIVDEDDVIRFEDGRGFGHGVGLCQWGAEGQARAGKYAGEILLYYYPGAKIVRAY